MKGWKIGGIVSFSIITIVYGIIIYVLSKSASVSAVFEVLKTYPIMVIVFVPVGIVIGLIVSALKFFFKPEKPKRKRKGQIWVSTVLYIALGIVAMTLILSAGIPMINKMKDRNTIIESKGMMHAIEQAITTVVGEGPGSRRVLDPVIIKGGKLIFDPNEEQVRWEMKTATMIMEPCVSYDGCNNIQREGSVKFYLLETIVEDEYMVHLLLDYPTTVNLDMSESEIKGSLVGSYLIAISNDGVNGGIVTVGIYVS